jgi:hypothetical protein
MLHTEKDGKIIREAYPSLPGDYGKFYKNLYQTIVNKAPLLEKPEHGYNTIRLIQQAFESSDKRRTIECSAYLD